MSHSPIITVGRICAQKDPEWFFRAHAAYRGERPWVWVGGASEDDDQHQAVQRRMVQAGITVTGWVDRRVLVTWYKRAHVYVHTAAWEGFPVSILEAAHYSLPIVARDIPAVKAEGVEYLGTNPVHLARWVEQLDDEYQWRRAVVWTAAWVAKREERQSQREALLTAYGIDTDTLMSQPAHVADDSTQ